MDESPQQIPEKGKEEMEVNDLEEEDRNLDEQELDENPPQKRSLGDEEQENTRKRPLNILRHFVFDESEYEVDIIWENDNPLFRASDVAKIIDIKDIHTSVANFDGDEISRRSMPTPGGIQNVLVLTDIGLYRLLFNSRKPIAKRFQKWVANVIREIQQTGRYEADDLHKKLKKENKRADESEHNALISAFHRKNVVYFGKIREIQGKVLMKIGSTYDIKRRAGELIEQFGSISFFFVVECALFRNFEQFLRNHRMICPHAFTKSINEDNDKSNEVYLMTLDEIERAKEVAKRNLPKYRTSFIVAPPEDIREIKEKLDQQEESMRKLTEVVLGKQEAQKKEENLFEVQTDIRTHTQGKGDKIQRYSPDGKQLLETYASYMDALRDDKIDSPSRAQMKLAAEGNYVYKGFRWARLDRELPDDTVQELDETTKTKTVRKGLVAMLNLKQTEIVKVFGNQKEAAADREFSSCAAISAAIKRGSQSGGHFFKMWFDCPEELKAAYLEINDLPDRILTGKAMKVQQTDQHGNTKIFPCIQDVQKEYGVGRTKLQEAITNGIPLRGFLWSWVK